MSILDKIPSGPGLSSALAMAGAASPLPRNRVVYLGKQGLVTTAAMVDKASCWDISILLQDGLLCLALPKRQEEDLWRTVQECLDLAMRYN